jgi:hypothetical protein
MKHKFRFLFVLVPAAFITLAIFVTMGLWNWLMPALFGLGTLTFLKAAGILILAKILFGHKGSHGWHGHHMRYAHAGGSCSPHSFHKEHWMAHRWNKMSPEQREKFGKRCGFHHPEESAPETPSQETK